MIFLTFVLSLLLLPANTLNSTEPTPGLADDDSSDVDSTRTDRIIFVLVGVIGLIFNLLILLALIRNGTLLSRFPRIFVCSQSGLDIACSILVILHQYWGYPVSSKLPEGVPNPAIFCSVFWSTYIQWAFMNSSTSNLLFQTIQRYLSVCHSTWHRRYMTTRVVGVLVACGWVSGFILELYMNRFTYMEEDGTCVYVPSTVAMERFNGIVIVSWMFIFPIMWITFCNGKIIHHLRKQRKLVAPGENGAATNKEVNAEKKRKEQYLRNTFMAVGLAYIICHAPSQVTWAVFMLGGPFYPEEVWYAFTVGMAFVNAVVNPIIYLVRMKGMRSEVASLLSCGICSSQKNKVENTSTTQQPPTHPIKSMVPVD